MSDPIKSRPMFHSTACERCAFGSGQHADFCPWRVQFVEGNGMRSYSFDPEKWRGVVEAIAEKEMRDYVFVMDRIGKDLKKPIPKL